MKHKCFCSHFFGKIALLVAITLLEAWPLAAQQYLQVMVAGPWSYVTDNSFPGRLLLVAPGNSKTHKAYLIPGANPLPPYPASITPGIYTLNLWNPSGQYTAPTSLIAPALCGASVDSTSNNYKSALGTTNYVISLPMPAAYSTYTGAMGTSESEVSAVTTTSANHAPPAQYTTWMVLYYPQADGLVDQSKNQYADGASIVLSDYVHNDNYCDHVSLASIQERNLLWNIKQYVRFPELVPNSMGVQISGVYDYAGCSDSDPAGFPPYNPLSPSSADCHACQLDVNGVVNLSADAGAKVFDSGTAPKKK